MSGSRPSDLVVAADASSFAGVYSRSRVADTLAARVTAIGTRVRPAQGCVCAVAGELYDGGALAQDLDLRASASLETILALGYTRWGTAMLERLRGSFGCLVWDPAGGEGVLAVDALGNGSLYVFEHDDWLAFASDVRLLLRVLPRRPPPDELAVAHWIASRTLPKGLTLHAGVSKLGGGTRLCLRDGWSSEVYWTPTYREPLDLDEETAPEAVWDALVDSIARRTGDGSLAIMMSGGVDSAAVATATLQSSVERQPRGYSAVFPGHPHRRVDESERIDQLVSAIGIANVQIRIEPTGALAHAIDWIRTWELPLSSPGYMLERPLLEAAARDGCTVVLDGQGGDELFSASSFLLADLLASGNLLAGLRRARQLPGVNHSRRTIAAALWAYSLFALPPRIQTLLAPIRRRGGPRQPWLRRRLQPLLRSADELERSGWTRELDGPRWWSYKAHLLTRLREDVGVAEYLRHRAEPSGLRARPPLLDQALVELAIRIPPALEFDPHYDRPLIRRAMAGRVPDAVRLSTLKSNLAPFYIETVARSELPAIRRLLDDPTAEIYAYAEPAEVSSLLASPPKGVDFAAAAWEVDVWKLAVVECWLRAEAGGLDALDPLLRSSVLSAPRAELYHGRAPA